MTDRLPFRLSIPPDPAQVRTARLVAVAVARQLEVPPEVFDEVGLAVGEACSRAVMAHVNAGLTSPVCLAFGVADERFVVEVADSGSGAAPTAARLDPDFTDLSEGNVAAIELAIVARLADSMDIANVADKTIVAMRWLLHRKP